MTTCLHGGRHISINFDSTSYTYSGVLLEIFLSRDRKSCFPPLPEENDDVEQILRSATTNKISTQIPNVCNNMSNAYYIYIYGAIDYRCPSYIRHRRTIAHVNRMYTFRGNVTVRTRVSEFDLDRRYNIIYVPI